MRILRLLCLAAAVSIGPSCTAAIITFDGFTVGPSPGPFSEPGYSISFSVPADASNGISAGIIGGPVNNALVFGAGVGGGNAVVISSATPFTFSQIDLGPSQAFLPTVPIGTISFAGSGGQLYTYSPAGGTSSITTLSGVFGGFTGLTSLTITGLTPGDIIGLDNIHVTGTLAAVPEPSSFALIGAIGAFGVWKRRRSQKAA